MGGGGGGGSIIALATFPKFWSCFRPQIHKKGLMFQKVSAYRNSVLTWNQSPHFWVGIFLPWCTLAT